jgi:hypothetical protein
MSRTLTASDRSALIRLASTLPVGSGDRRAILAGLRNSTLAMGGHKKAAGPHPLNPRSVRVGAFVYFELAELEYQIIEDMEKGDKYAHSLMRDDGRGINKLKEDALKNLSRMFGQRIDKGRYGRAGELPCTFGVDSWGDVKKTLDVIKQRRTGNGEEIDTGVQYIVATNFLLYPDGMDGVAYGEGSGEGDWDKWLAEHK